MRSGLLSFFLYKVKTDPVPPSEACLYGCISWSLAQAQAHHQFSLGLSESSISVRGERAKPWVVLWFNVQKWPVSESDGASLAKKPHIDPKFDGHQCDRKSSGGASSSTTDSRRK